MLTLTGKKGDTVTLEMIDGTLIGHICFESISDKQARIVYCFDDDIKIKRDTASAERAFADVRRNGKP